MSSIWYDKKDARGHRICRYLFDRWCMKCDAGDKEGSNREELNYSLCEVSDEEYLESLPAKYADNPHAKAHIESMKRMFSDKDTSTKTRFYSDFSAKYF